MNREAAAYFIQLAYKRRQGTEVFSRKHDGYALTESKVVNTSVKTKVGPIDMSIFNELKRPESAIFDEIEGRSGIRGAIRVQRGKRYIGEFDSLVSVVKINMRMFGPNQKASVQIFKKQGYIIINTNGPWERVVRILAQTYFPGKFHEMMKNVIVNNILARFFVNRHINTKLLMETIDNIVYRRMQGSENLPWTRAGGLAAFSHQAKPPGWMIPEEVPRLFKSLGRQVREVAVISAKDTKIVLNIFPSGSVIASGPADTGVLWFESLVKDLGTGFLLSEKKGLGAKITRKEAKRAAITQNRNPEAPSWNANHPNQSVKTFVRPGPNGKPRYYLFTSAELQRAKTIRAFLEAGVNIPQKTKNLFQITPAHIAEVKAAMAAPAVKPPTGWNNRSRSGYYVRPDSQGKPKWYELPAGIASGKKTLLKAYSKFGVEIPQWLKNHFKISNSEMGKFTVPHVNFGTNKKLRINGKNATRFNKEALLAVAGNMGVKSVTNRMNKLEIAGAIKSKLAPARERIDLTLNGVHHTFLANGTVRRNYKNKPSRTRQFSTLKADERATIARAFLPANKYNSFKVASAADQYKILLNHKSQKEANRRAAALAGPAKPKAPSPETPENVWDELELEFRIEFTMSNIDIKYLPELMKRVKALGVGARGHPLRAKVDAVKAKFLKELSAQREINLKKAAFKTKLVMPAYIPANKVNAYKNFLANFAATKKNGKWPSRAQIKAAAKTWIRTHFPQRSPQAARTFENMLTGQVTHVPAYAPSPRASPNVPKFSPPIKKKEPPKSPVGTKRKIPMNERFDSMVNNMNRMGHKYNPNRVYSWEDLAKMGVSNKYRNTWLNYVRRT